VKGPHRILVIVIWRSWPGQSAQACSSDVFPLPAGAEMIVSRFRTAQSSVATRSWRPISPCRAVPAAQPPRPTCRSSRHLLQASGQGNPRGSPV